MHIPNIRRAGAAILAKARAVIDDTPDSSDLEIIFVQHEELPNQGTMVRGSTGRAWELVFTPRQRDWRYWLRKPLVCRCCLSCLGTGTFRPLGISGY